VFVDLPAGVNTMGEEVAAGSVISESTSGVTSVTGTLAPVAFRFQPAATANRTITVQANGSCENAPTPTVSLDSVSLKVAGTR
jgi:hypothetical protein